MQKRLHQGALLLLVGRKATPGRRAGWHERNGQHWKASGRMSEFGNIPHLHLVYLELTIGGSTPVALENGFTDVIPHCILD